MRIENLHLKSELEMALNKLSAVNANIHGYSAEIKVAEELLESQRI